MVTCTNVLSLYNDVLLLYCTHCCVLQVCNVLSISVNTCLLYISSTVLWRTFRESVYDTASMSIRNELVLELGAESERPRDRDQPRRTSAMW